MDIHIKQLRNAEIEVPLNEKEVTIKLTEQDGSYYGVPYNIKIPAKSYCFLEEAIVERWLENKKSI